MNSSQEQSADLREYTRIVRARKWEIAVIVITVVAVAMGLTLRQTPIYQGTADVLVQPIQNPLAPYSAPQIPNLATEQQLVMSQIIGQQVRKSTGATASASALVSHLNVGQVPNSNVLVISYRDTDPKVAAMMANAYATAYIDFRTQQATSQLAAAADALKRRIDGLQAQLSGLDRRIAKTNDPSTVSSLQSQRDSIVSQQAVLQGQYFTLLPNPAIQLSAGQVVQRASVPHTPVSPDKTRNAILGLCVGLALGIGFALLRERLDDRVKSREEVERRLGAPVLASVPRVSGWRKAEEAYLVLRADSRSPVAEAYRTLATNVQYLSSQRSLRVIMVTSAVGGEGKSTTSANLAVALAQTGKRVVLVSADLRKPRIHRFFGLLNGVGLSDYLSGNLALTIVAQESGVRNLRVIASGPAPENPSGLLGSGRNEELLEALREVADFVIVDTPPLLAVADASILAPMVDGTIYVMDASQSGRSAIAHARDQLQNAGGSVLGVVYNNFDPAKAKGYGYYSYYTVYYAGDSNGRNGHGNARSRKRDRAAVSNANGTSAPGYGFAPDLGAAAAPNGHASNGNPSNGTGAQPVALPAAPPWPASPRPEPGS